MTRPRFAAALVVLTIALIAVAVRDSAQQPTRQPPAPCVGAGTIHLNGHILDPVWPFALFAFVETGSDPSVPVLLCSGYGENDEV